MNRTDALVAAIGAGVLVVALTGAALTGTTAGSTFTVTWTTESAEHDLGSEALQNSGEAEFVYDNPHTNVLSLTFDVDVGVEAGHAATDEVGVTIVAPDGTETAGTGTVSGVTGGSATVSVRVDIGSVPMTTDVAAATPADALASVPANTTGQGVWTVRVALTHGAAVPQAHTLAAKVGVEWVVPEIAPEIPTAR